MTGKSRAGMWMVLAVFIVLSAVIVLIPQIVHAEWLNCPSGDYSDVNVTRSGDWWVTDYLCTLCKPYAGSCGLCDHSPYFPTGYKIYNLDGTYTLTSSRTHVYVDNLAFSNNLPWIKCAAGTVDIDAANICMDSACSPNPVPSHNWYGKTPGWYLSTTGAKAIASGPMDFNNIKLGYLSYTSTWIRFRWPVDDDADGYGAYEDCNDLDEEINPGAAELCNGVDDNCNGQTDEGCSCTSGETSSCGPSSETGECAFGMQTCDVSGTWSACAGAVMPSAEICNDYLDNDCDSEEDCDDPDCLGSPSCTPKTQYITIPKIADVYIAEFDVTGATAVNPQAFIGEGDNTDLSIWSYSGTLDSTATIDDFSDQLNNYIDNVCTAPLSGQCDIPIRFNADSGAITVDSIKVQFTDYWWNTWLLPNGFNYRVQLVAEEVLECGNGKIEGAEECDDGNLDSNDGCSPSCEKEDVWGFECVYSATECSALGPNYIEVLRASGTSDAHASLPEQGDFTNYICCKIGGTGASLTDSCADSQAVFLQLSDTEDAHVQEYQQGGFTNDACLSINPASKGVIGCTYADDCAAAGGVCLASISDPADAHIGNCDAYDTKVCCGIGIVAPPANNCADFGGEICTADQVCEGGTMQTADDTDYCCVGGTCQLPACNNDGVLDAGEECDDGNVIAYDGCSPICEKENIVFVTNGMYKPSSGTDDPFGADRFWSILGASIRCTEEAEAAGLYDAVNNRYKPWLSISLSDAYDNFHDMTYPDRPFYLTDGTKVADNWDDLIDGELDSPINEDAGGNDVCTSDYYVWTGTGQDGQGLALNCNNWNDGTASYLGAFGYCSDTVTWSYYGSGTPPGALCNNYYRIYCMAKW